MGRTRRKLKRCVDKDMMYRHAMQQGTHRNGRETFEEFEKRIADTYMKETNRPPPWRYRVPVE